MIACSCIFSLPLPTVSSSCSHSHSLLLSLFSNSDHVFFLSFSSLSSLTLAPPDSVISLKHPFSFYVVFLWLLFHGMFPEGGHWSFRGTSFSYSWEVDSHSQFLFLFYFLVFELCSYTCSLVIVSCQQSWILSFFRGLVLVCFSLYPQRIQELFPRCTSVSYASCMTLLLCRIWWRACSVGE